MLLTPFPVLIPLQPANPEAPDYFNPWTITYHQVLHLPYAVYPFAYDLRLGLTVTEDGSGSGSAGEGETVTVI